MKECTLCKKVKSFSDFYPCDRYSDGFRCWCKECCNNKHKVWVNKNRLHTREYMKQWRESHGILLEKYKERYRDKKRIRTIAWGKKNINKVKAHRKLWAKRRRGKIQIPTICSVCGKELLIAIAHHEDYSKPFDVIWMCQSCHLLEHKN